MRIFFGVCGVLMLLGAIWNWVSATRLQKLARELQEKAQEWQKKAKELGL